MKKFDFEYVYEYSAMRYHKIIEAESQWAACAEFDRQTMTDPSICVCEIKEIK